MKILFFSYAYPNPVNPGLGTFNRTMIAGLANEHELRVVSPVPFMDSWKAWAQGRLPHGLNDSTFKALQNVKADYCTWYYTPKFFRHQYGKFMRLSVRSTLNRVMKEFQPDIVLSYWTHPDGEVAVETAHRLGIRAVAMVGGTDVLVHGRDGSRRESILNVLHAADGVVTVSEDIKNVLVADGIPTRKLSVVRRGIDRRLFHEGDRAEARRKLGLPDDRRILVSVGRLVEVKGHTHLIEACRLLAQRRIPFRCYLLGEGHLRSKIERQIEQAGLSDVITLRGTQTPTQLADWYRAADLSILPSLSEGVPNVLLESIASGTPFVASNVGGVPEIADVSLDSLVPPANPVALADAIASRLENVKSSSRHYRRFEPSTMLESTEHLSSILQSVQTGRSTLLTSEAIMHETMTEADLATVRSAASSAAIASASVIAPDDATASNDGPIDQFDDYHQLHELFSSASETATVAVRTNPCVADRITFAHERIPTGSSDKQMVTDLEDHLCARLGEYFNLRVAPKSSSAVSTQGTKFEPNRNDFGDRERDGNEELADEVVTARSYSAGQSDYDELGRTGEGFYYRP